jgi:nucleoside-diphosphate-sugar epimerase
LIPRLLERARAGLLRLVGRGDKLVDATYIDNAVEAHLLAADRLAPESACAGNAYFIAQGEPVPARELINSVLHAAGLQPVTRSVPARVAWLAGALAEMVYRLLRIEEEPPVTRFAAIQLATAHWYDLGAARRDLGYAPSVSTAEGLRRLRMSLDTRHIP